MKNIFILITILLFVGCSTKINKDDIIGTWDIYGASSIPMKSEIEKNDAFQGWSKFNSDGSFEGKIQTKSSNGITQVGTYKINDNVLITTFGGKDYKSKIGFKNGYLFTVSEQPNSNLKLYIYYKKRP